MLLELKNINVIFQKPLSFLDDERKIHVLKDINLTIDKGEIVTIVGESGCGKTTMGKIITGLIKPTSGELFYNGKNIYNCTRQDMDNYRRGVQFVQQDSYAALNPVRTIYQSLYAPLKKRYTSTKQIETKMNELLDLVELSPVEQFLSKYPHQLSGGQRQRILLARALSLNPELIVADEPISMIDVSLRAAMLGLFSRLNKTLNISIVYITHDLATARYVAQDGKMNVMYIGEMVECGPTNDVLTHPRHPYTQALLCAVPIPDPHIEKNKKQIPLKGMDLASIEDRCNGCTFSGRCLYADSDCSQTKQEYAKVGNQLVLCKNHEKVPMWISVK